VTEPARGLIDLHAHLAPRLPAGAWEPRVPPDLGRPEALLEHLDRLGLDQAVVSIPPPFYRQELPPDDAAAWIAAVNDGLAEVVADKHRLSAFAYLPLEHPPLARREIKRVDGWGFVGFTAAAGGRSASLADGELEPLWQALDQRDAALLLHPGEPPDPRLAPMYLGNLLGNPFETTLAAAQLIFGDVPGRFPRIRFVLAHGGGAVAALIGRWQRGVDTDRPGLGQLTEGPLEAIKRFYVDSITHHPEVTALVRRVIGPDHVVFGSDWPFPMGSTESLEYAANAAAVLDHA
jgi:aminocarboxymuconate-semialdehyde decarboxylase